MAEMPRAEAPDAAAAALEAAFEALHRERMHDVPILNRALRVACIGMQACDDGKLAALVTPWFINLMLLPAGEEAEAWGRLALGSKSLHQFPAGRFEFILGELPQVGRYRMCSLFSPVLEFEDQAAAELTAAAALAALFDPAQDQDGGVEPRDSAAETSRSAVAKPGAAAVPIVPTRRGLLFGLSAAQGGRS